jgi:hypothetical protein
LKSFHCTRASLQNSPNKASTSSCYPVRLHSCCWDRRMSPR